jgi:hypothetical protein
LITRAPLFVGYSIDHPDFGQSMVIVAERVRHLFAAYDLRRDRL